MLRAVVLVALVFGCTVLALQAGAPPASPPAGGEKAVADAQLLERAAAEARLALAEANLRQALERNKRVARSVPQNVIAQYRANVAVARTFLDGVGRGPSDFKAWLRHAEAIAEMTENAWRSALGANRFAAQAVEEPELLRLKLERNLARRQLERGRLLASGPPEVRAAWQLQVVYDEMQRLERQLLRQTSTGSSYPMYWF